MEVEIKPNFETHQAALKEYFEKQKVESICCERCKELIIVKEIL